jgi:hypothetical protein
VARKKHNPGCPCCEPTACPCLDNPSASSRAFANTPTVKLVISGLPAVVEFHYVRYGWFAFGENTRYTHRIEGLDAGNGTYFFDQNKENLVCPVSATGIEFFSVSWTQKRDIYTRSTCAFVSTETDSFSQDLSVLGFLTGGEVAMPGNFFPYWEIYGTKFALCEDDFDPNLNEGGTNGDIILAREFSIRGNCDGPSDPNIIVEDVIGSIVYELLDL